MIKIYIVEDDQNIREIEKYALENTGYEVEEFERASGFFEKLEKQLPQLILLDIMLPDDDGLHIVKEIRSNKKWADIPIILLTAKTTEMDKVKGLDIGADDYMTKHFGVMELISRVKALLRRTSDNRMEEKILEFQNITVNLEKHIVKVDNEICELTFKE